MAKPTHTHDCENCTYIATIASKDRAGQVADLYTCANDESRTFIARYGDEGPDYSSLPDFILFNSDVNHHRRHDIQEAYTRYK